jgi:hypothetical protein
MLKYQKKLAEFNITDLQNENLDPAFVAKVNDFTKKMQNGSLDDKEIADQDEELCSLFDQLHDFEEIPSEELTEMQRANTNLTGKQSVINVKTINELKAILKQYAEFPEVCELADKKITDIQNQNAKKEAENQERQRVSDLIAKATTIDELKSISKDLPENVTWVVEMVNNKANELNARRKSQQQNQNNEIQTKLLSKTTWTYDELRAIGIEPTGDDMVVHGIKMAKRYLFKAYEIEGKSE